MSLSTMLVDDNPLGKRDKSRAVGVLFYIPNLGIGGTETCLCELAIGLGVFGYKTSVWVLKSGGPIGHRLREGGVPVYQMALDSARLTQVAQWLSTLNIDVFHTFSYQLHCLEVLAARAAEIPIAVARRSNIRHWDHLSQGRDWEFQRNDLVDAIVANCNAVARICRDVELAPANKIHVIYNGVALPADVNALRAHRLANDSPTLVIGTVGNLRSVKDHGTLIDAMALVTTECSPVRLVIWGADQGEGRVLVDRIRKLGLTDFVTLVTSGEGTPPYATFDIYVQSSIAEGFSNSLLEAMSNGLPVVATDVGGTSEVVEHERTGLLVRPRDPAELARAIVRLVHNSELRMRLGLQGREIVAAAFQTTVMIAEHARLYSVLLARKGGK